jgi:hypothetical protein
MQMVQTSHEINYADRGMGTINLSQKEQQMPNNWFVQVWIVFFNI